MSEEDVREGLRDAVTDEPPLNFDPDVLVTTARQRAARRRALVAVGTATVAIAVAAVAIPARFDSGTTPAATQPSAPTTSTQYPAAPNRYTADYLRARGGQMRTYLGEILPAVVPGASAVEYGEFGGEAAGEFSDGQNYINAPVTFTLDGARYSIFLTAYVAGGTVPTEASVCAAPCHTLDVHADGVVMATTEDLGQQKIITVYHFRRGGSVVQVAAYNYDMTGVPAYQPTIPVTLDQLARLATASPLGL